MSFVILIHFLSDWGPIFDFGINLTVLGATNSGRTSIGIFAGKVGKDNLMVLWIVSLDYDGQAPHLSAGDK